MIVYLIGANGWIGQKILKILYDKKIDVIFSNIRAEKNEIYFDILKNSVTHVLCCSGRTHGIINDISYKTIDYLEHKRTTWQNLNDNLYVPVSMAQFCDENNIHFTYIGTGCIYNYDEIHKEGGDIGFTEDDDPNFFGSQYSIVKGFTDKLLKNTKALVLRIRMPISSDVHERNFISKITTYNKICSIKNSMTVLNDMLPLCIEMMISKDSGTYNFTNPGTISHNEILELYKKIVDPNFEWENFTIEEQNKILKSKRSNNYLDTSKLEEKYFVKNIKDAVTDALRSMKDHIEYII